MEPFLYLKKNPLIAKVAKFSAYKKRRVFLVGGWLRDLFLKKESRDFDFAVDSGAIKLARFIANRARGNFVVLDEEHGSARVIVKEKDKFINLDFTDFRGSSIRQDLFKRDFTINAIGMDLAELKKTRCLNDILLDPYRGRADIKKRIIKVVSEAAFSDDPLRILRLFSLSAGLGFKADGKTLALAQKEKDKLPLVSAERIREELFKILKSKGAADFFKFMDECGILQEVIPQINLMRGVAQGPYHHLDVLEHSFEAMRQMDNLIVNLSRNKRIAGYLGEIIGAEHCRGQLLKLAAFLHDIGKPGALTFEEGKTKFHGHEHIGRRIASLICDKLKLSLKEKEAIKLMILWHLRPGYLADTPEITQRGIFRYFRDTGDEGVSIILLSIADQRSTRGPLTKEKERLHHEKTCRWLIKEYFRRKDKKKLPRILSGDDLIRKLKLVPSPLFREILEKIEEEQALGGVSTKKEALELAGKIAKNFKAVGSKQRD